MVQGKKKFNRSRPRPEPRLDLVARSSPPSRPLPSVRRARREEPIHRRRRRSRPPPGPLHYKRRGRRQEEE